MEDYPGSFGEWEQARAERAKRLAVEVAREADEARQRGRDKAKRAHGERQARAADKRAARRVVEEAEALAHRLEASVAALTDRLHDAALYTRADGAAEAARLQTELAEMQAALDRALEAWADAEQQLTVPVDDGAA
jgi:hypothetical protein